MDLLLCEGRPTTINGTKYTGKSLFNGLEITQIKNQVLNRLPARKN